MGGVSDWCEMQNVFCVNGNLINICRVAYCLLTLSCEFLLSCWFCWPCPVRYSLKAPIGFLARESMKKVRLLQKLLRVRLTLKDLRLMASATWIGFHLATIWMKRMFSKGMYLRSALSLEIFDAPSILSYDVQCLISTGSHPPFMSPLTNLYV